MSNAQMSYCSTFYALLEGTKTVIADLDVKLDQRPFRVVQPDIRNDIIYNVSRFFLENPSPPNFTTLKEKRKRVAAHFVIIFISVRISLTLSFLFIIFIGDLSAPYVYTNITTS